MRFGSGSGYSVAARLDRLPVTRTHLVAVVCVDFDFPAAFHGVDERVPVESVRFGARVLDTFFDLC